MSPLRHRMIRTHGDVARSLFTCTVAGCGRQVLLDHVEGTLLVLTAGMGVVHVGVNVRGPICTPHDVPVPL